MRQPYRSALFASLILVICAGVLWAAYDWFQDRYLSTFSEQTACFRRPLQLPAELAGQAHPTGALLGPACPAMSATNNTWRTDRALRPQGVEFYALQKPGSHGQLPDNLRNENPRPARRRPSAGSPAVGIGIASGKLAYFGPTAKPDVQFQQQF